MVLGGICGTIWVSVGLGGYLLDKGGICWTRWVFVVTIGGVSFELDGYLWD